MMIESKQDRDRLRHRVSKRKQVLDTIQRLCREYDEGRAASECMKEIKRVINDAKT